MVLKFKDDYTLNNLSKDELINNVLYNEIGKTFAKCLEDAGVYKRTDEGKKAFLKFPLKLSIKIKEVGNVYFSLWGSWIHR